MAIKKRYTELPEHIIQYILSFLPEKDATKTSILSKACLRAWRTKPNLDFDSDLFLGEDFNLWRCEWEEREKKSKVFCKYVKTTLKRYTEQNIGIETLKLDLTSARYLLKAVLIADSVVERCMQAVVETGLKNLEFLADGYYDLPGVLLEAKLLVSLSLGRVKMLHLSTEKIMWHSLKRLCLDKVYFDELMFGNIISICPFLEILKIYYCTDNHKDESNNQIEFKVMKHHNLKQLNVRLYPRQKLILGEAPKLESFVCKSNDEYMGDHYCKPCEFSLHSSQYQNLKMLLLCGVVITDDFFNNLEQKFPHIQDLSVQWCPGLKTIRISSHSLQRIQLKDNHKLKVAHFDVPSIELLVIHDEWETIPEFTFTATKGHWISYLKIRWLRNVHSSWFLHLKKFLVNLIPSKIFLDIEILGDIMNLNMNKIRNSVSFSEPQELQELSLFVAPWDSYIRSALDAFFLICRPNSLSHHLENYGSKNDSSLKELYDRLMLRTNQDDQHDQKLQEMKYWQHDLMQVKVGIYELRKCRAGDAIVYFKKGLVEPQPEALDWESILKVLKSTPSFMRRRVYFMLNWKNSLLQNEPIATLQKCCFLP